MLARMLKSRGVAVIEDTRASKRDNYAPAKIEMLYRDEPIAEIMDEVTSQSPCPVALVSDTGRVFVLTSGGSGQIVAVGGPTPEQDDAVLAVREVLHDLWGVTAAAPKRSKKKPVEVVEPVTVEEAEELADFIEVLNSIAEGEHDAD